MIVLPDEFSYVDLTDPQFSSTLDLILNGNQNLNIIGPAGCGKSLLITMCSKLLTGRTVLCSTTGISAVNISSQGVKASTLHSFFRLDPLPFYPPHYLKYDDKMKKRLSVVDTIIIDETSMMSAHLFDTLFYLIRMYRSVAKFPRIILFSDILQLPPVVSFNNKEVHKLFEKDYGSNVMFFNARHYEQMEFKAIHLNKLYRQKDASFQSVLNRMREGTHTKDDLGYINRFSMPLAQYDKKQELYTHLVTTNKAAGLINERYYNMFDEQEYSYQRHVSGDTDRQVLKTIEERVHLKVGLQVMCVKNNAKQGYQNGTVGKIVSLEDNSNDGDESVTIKTKDGAYLNVIREVWKHSDYEKQDDKLVVVEKGAVSQIGCKLAKSLTTHKSQGMTLDSMYYDPGNWVFSEALTYVALSRIRNVENLGLARTLRMDDIRANEESLRFLEKEL